MGILDNIIGRSPFLRNTQSFMGQQSPQPPVQPAVPQLVQPPVAQQQGQPSGNGPDMSMIMKIISMFGGV